MWFLLDIYIYLCIALCQYDNHEYFAPSAGYTEYPKLFLSIAFLPFFAQLCLFTFRDVGFTNQTESQDLVFKTCVISSTNTHCFANMTAPYPGVCITLVSQRSSEIHFQSCVSEKSSHVEIILKYSGKIIRSSAASAQQKTNLLNFTDDSFYPAFSFIPSIALLRFRLVKSSAKLMMYVDTHTIQKSPRTKTRIDAR